MSRDNLRKLKLTTLLSFIFNFNLRFMKTANKKQVNNLQVNNNGCQHVQLGGVAYYDDKQYFLFSPDSVNQGVVEAFRRHGVAQQMQDGTFDFVAVSKPKSQSELIKKLAHGRLSKTKDGAIQLTLKVFVP